MSSAQEITLPSEIWRIVFLKMDNKTRLVAKLVCKDWYHTLASDELFAKYRVLHIEDIFLNNNHPVVKVLIESLTKFNELKLKYVKFDVDSDLDSFWNKLSLTVTTISVNLDDKSVRMYFYEKFKKFNKLKFLKINDVEYWVDKTDNGTDNFQQLESVESFSIDFENHYNAKFYDPNDDLRKMLRSMPNLKDIHLTEIMYDPKVVYNILEEFSDKIKTFSVRLSDEEDFDIEDIKNYSKKILEPFRGSPITHLNLSIQHLNATLDDIYAIMDTFPHLKTCELSSGINELPISKADKITELFIDADEDELKALDLRKLNQFKHLKALTIFGHFNDGCFFQHTESEITVQELHLFFPEISCSTCFETFIKSCKHLKSLMIQTKNGIELEAVIKIQEQLQELRISVSDLKADHMQRLEQLKLCTKVTSLSVELVRPYEIECFKANVHTLDSLRSIELGMKDGSAAIEIFKQICQALPQLEEIRFQQYPRRSGYSSGPAPKNASLIFNIDDLFCLPSLIKTVWVPYLYKQSHHEYYNKIFKLFNTFSRLTQIYISRYLGILHRREIEEALSKTGGINPPLAYDPTMMERLNALVKSIPKKDVNNK